MWSGKCTNYFDIIYKHPSKYTVVHERKIYCHEIEIHILSRRIIIVIIIKFVQVDMCCSYCFENVSNKQTILNTITRCGEYNSRYFLFLLQPTKQNLCVIIILLESCRYLKSSFYRGQWRWVQFKTVLLLHYKRNSPCYWKINKRIDRYLFIYFFITLTLLQYIHSCTSVRIRLTTLYLRVLLFIVYPHQKR